MFRTISRVLFYRSLKGIKRICAFTSLRSFRQGIREYSEGKGAKSGTVFISLSAVNEGL